MISSRYLDEWLECSESQRIGVSFGYNILGGTKNRVRAEMKLHCVDVG